jgi:hypothetical protein
MAAMNPAISAVKCAIDTDTREIGVETVLAAIRTGGKKLRGQVTQIRNRFDAELAITGGDLQKAKLAVEKLKKSLPGAMWCGQYSNREHPAADKLQKHSGLLCADLDSLGQELETIREKLKTSPYLFALFLSPTGNGLKAVFRVPADASQHAGSFRAVAQHVFSLTGAEVDPSRKDIGGLCFMSYDPHLYHNPDAIELEPLPEAEKPKAAFNSNGEINLSERQRIAGEMLGNIDWTSEASGYPVCPGKHLHTAGDGERDCEIHLDGAPTIHCFHDHCRGILEGVSRELRSRIGKAEFVPAPQDETIERLAALSLIEYDRRRKEEARKLECRESTLDSLVHAKRLLMRPGASDNSQGSAVDFPDVEPWESPVNGAEVLSEVADRFSHYLALPPCAADALSLWTTHTHAYEASVHTPRLNLYSPEKQCGKSTGLDVLATMVARPLRTESITSAVLFRLVEQHKPTLLLDEVDAYLNDSEELRGLLNAGHRRGAKAYRCQGENNTVHGFSAFAPAALAGIGALPGTLHDRSIVIKLVRAKAGEIAARFDSRRVQIESELCRKLARWTADKFDQLNNCDPQLPANAFNRLADNWRPLFAIAEAAGADWPQRVCAAFMALTATADLDAQGVGTMLLADILALFAAEKADRLPSSRLAEFLVAIEGRPWAEWGKHRKPISTNQLANQLRRFGISPRGIRVGDETPRGYLLDDFKEAFSRYLPDTPFPDCNNATTLGKTAISEVQQPEFVLHPEKAPFTRECCTIAPGKEGEPEKGDISGQKAEQSTGKEKLRL